MQPEAKLVKKIQSYIRRKGGWCVKIHGGDNPFQQVGIPDLLCCYRGRFFALEVKVPGGKVSRLQYQTLRGIREAGGVGAVVSSITEVKRLLEGPDPAWVAGFFEGEGHVGVRDGFKPHVGIAQKEITPLTYIQGYFGGSISKTINGNHRLRIYNEEEVRRFLETVRPHLKSEYKRRQVDQVWRILGKEP